MEARYSYIHKRAVLEQEFQELSEEYQKMAQDLQNLNKVKKRLQAEVSFLNSRAKLIKESARTTEGIKEHFSARESSIDLPSNIPAVSKSLPSKPRFPQKLTGDPRSRAPIAKALAQAKAADQTFTYCEPVETLKSSSRYATNGLLESKKSGKRKISWQD